MRPQQFFRPTLPFRQILRLAGLAVFLSLGFVQNVAAATNKVFVFSGKIGAVDPTARTILLNANKRSYLFVVTDQTKLLNNGAPARFADLKSGREAEIEMKIGPGGRGIASSVKLFSVNPSEALPAAVSDSVVAGTAPNGARLSAQQVQALVVSATWPSSPVQTRGRWGHRIGVFLLSVRSDGTVSKVEVIQSIGNRFMDGDVITAFMKWRFRPNSVREVRIPANYTRRLW